MKNILDPSFRYSPSYATDLRRTFARLRRGERAAEKRRARKDAVAILHKVA